MVWKWFQFCLLLLVSLLFYIPSASCVYCKTLTVQNLLGFFLDHISVCWNCSNWQVHFSLSRFMVSELLLGMVLLLCACWFHNVVTLFPRFVSTVWYVVIPVFNVEFYPCFLALLLSSLYAEYLQLYTWNNP